MRADLSDRVGVHAAAERVAGVFGEPDILVNSAGINLRPPMSTLTEGVWDATIVVNLDAPFLLGQRFGPGMADRGFGRIIHVTSQQAHRAFADSGAYGVSKGAWSPWPAPRRRPGLPPASPATPSFPASCLPR